MAVRQIQFFVLILGLSVALAQGYHRLALSRVEDFIIPREPASVTVSELDATRRDALELLDQIVIAEHHFRSVYGFYTAEFEKVGIVIPDYLSDLYEIQATEASGTHFVVSAQENEVPKEFSKKRERPLDVFSLDESFSLKTTFTVPAPRPEYLVGIAKRQIRTLMDLPPNRSVEEQTVYRGYFRYLTEPGLSRRKSVVAQGVKSPVLGVRLTPRSELDTASSFWPNQISPDPSQVQGLNKNNPLGIETVGQAVSQVTKAMDYLPWTNPNSLKRIPGSQSKTSSNPSVPSAPSHSVEPVEILRAPIWDVEPIESL